MIRDEAMVLLTRYAEVLVALAVVILGVLGLRQPSPILQGIGVVLVAGGVAWGRVAFRRTRFGGRGDAPGAVVVDERRITYFAPFGGGSIALDDLMRIDLVPGAAPLWTLTAPGQETVNIPHDARSADVLIDAFASLPGFRMDRALAALDKSSGGAITVWRRDGQARLTSP